MQWFRFYNEAITDRKLLVIADDLQMDFIAVVGAWAGVLCLANQSPERGKLYVLPNRPCSIRNVSETLHVTDDVTIKLLQAFTDAGLLTFENNLWSVAQWEYRQFQSDNSTERVRKSREKKQNQENDVKRFRNVECNAPDTENRKQKTDTELPPKSPNGGVVEDSSLIAFSQRYDSLQPGTVTSAVQARLKSYLEKYGAQELDAVFDAAADMKAMGKLSNPLGFIRNVLEKRKVERESQPKEPEVSIYGVEITEHNPNGLPSHCRIDTGRGWLDPGEALERGCMDKEIYDKCIAELEAIAQKRGKAA